MNYTIKSPETESEWKNYYNFRWEMLRKPIGMSKQTVKDDLEKESYHLMVVNKKDKVIGSGRLHFNNKKDLFATQMNFFASGKRVKLITQK